MFKEKIVAQIINYIESNEDGRINISDIACDSGLSRRYVQVIFKEFMGIPIGKYLRVKRITKAATLLRLTNIPIIQISYLLYFDSQQTFTREFKKIAGYTPLFYRKTHIWHLDIYNIYYCPNLIPPIKPLLCCLLGGVLAGYKFCYDEQIPYLRIMGECRWYNIVRFKRKQQNNIWLLTEFHASERTIHSVSINTTIGVVPDNNNMATQTQYVYRHGLYAAFSFKGNREEYNHRIKEIYYKILPFWGYNRRQGPDVECFYHIENTDEGYICCDIYVPVEQNYIDRISCDKHFY